MAQRVVLKVLMWILLIAAALLLLVDAAANISLRGKQATRLVDKYADSLVKGDIKVGGGSFRYITSFPYAMLKLKDVSLSSETDTLLRFDELRVRANIFSALRKNINVPLLRLEGLQVNTFDFLNLPPADEDTTGKASLPRLNAFIEIPQARVTYPELFENVVLDIEAGARNSDRFDADVYKLTISVDGLKMDASAAADDILGEDPLLSLNATAVTQFEKLMAYLPGSLDGLKAGGALDLQVSAKALLSQLDVSKINDAEIQAVLSGDSFSLNFQHDTLFANAMRPHIEVRTQKDAPMLATVNAERIEIKDSDALVLQLDDSENRFTLTQIPVGGSTTPQLSARMFGSQLMLRSGEDRAAARNYSIDATAGIKRRRIRPGNIPDPRRHFRFEGDSLRTLEKPEWLSEKEFTAADVNFQIDESIVALLRKWTPYGQVKFESGVVVSPRLPLMNTISSFSATMNEDDLRFEPFTVKSGASDLSFSGSARGLYQVLASGEEGAVQLDLNTSSTRFNLDEILQALREGVSHTPAEADSVKEKSKIIVLPSNLIGRLELSASLFRYLGQDFRRVSLKGLMRERCLQLTDVSTYIQGLGEAKLDGFYSSKTKQNLSAAANLALKNVSVERLLELFPSLGASVPLLDTFTGELACNVAASTNFSQEMAIIPSSVQGSFHIEGKDLKVEDISSYRKYTRLLLFKDKQKGVINDLNVSGTVSDNIVEVFPFLLAVDRYALAFSGRQSFTDGYTYKVSLIESPLPIRLGVKLFGDDFSSRMRFRPMRPQFKDTRIPVFYEDEQQMRDRLASDIRNVFERGPESIIRNQHRLQLNLEQMYLRDVPDDPEEDELTEEELQVLDQIEVEWEIEAQNNEINQEIDQLLNDLWKI